MQWPTFASIASADGNHDSYLLFLVVSTLASARGVVEDAQDRATSVAEIAQQYTKAGDGAITDMRRPAIKRMYGPASVLAVALRLRAVTRIPILTSGSSPLPYRMDQYGNDEEDYKCEQAEKNHVLEDCPNRHGRPVRAPAHVSLQSRTHLTR